MQQNLDQKNVVLQNYSANLLTNRKKIMSQLENVIDIDKYYGDDMVYMQKLSSFVQSYIDNQDQYNGYLDDSTSIN